MRPTINTATINPARVVKSGPGRYTVLLVGLGAAGVALGWRGPDVAASATAIMKRR
ncbi:hypothetical protein [Actinomadura sp. 6N118]|uniref:hypothetical protein n=1 Tax=Actinomadura sp. 6N118 TaxID=3375151 RepID=UPI00379CB4B2